MKLCASSGATPEMVHSTFICSLKEALAGTADHCGSDSSLRPQQALHVQPQCSSPGSKPCLGVCS